MRGLSFKWISFAFGISIGLILAFDSRAAESDDPSAKPQLDSSSNPKNSAEEPYTFPKIFDASLEEAGLCKNQVLDFDSICKITDKLCAGTNAANCYPNPMIEIVSKRNLNWNTEGKRTAYRHLYETFQNAKNNEDNLQICCGSNVNCRKKFT